MRNTEEHPAERSTSARSHTTLVFPSLDQLGRLRAAHVQRLLAVSRATFYAGLSSGRYPKPDGYDGRMPYWLTSTIKAIL